MKLKPGKTYLLRPQMLNGVWHEKRTFRVDEIIQDGLAVKGDLDGEEGWTYFSSELLTELPDQLVTKIRLTSVVWKIDEVAVKNLEMEI